MKKKKPNAEPKRRGSRCSITFVEFETYLASYIYQHIYTIETINSPRCKDRRQSMGSEIEEPAITLAGKLMAADLPVKKNCQPSKRHSRGRS